MTDHLDAGPTRRQCITHKVKTDFGSCYVHIDLDAQGRPVGGSISTPMKEPESQITHLIRTLSEGLDAALAEYGSSELRNGGGSA